MPMYLSFCTTFFNFLKFVPRGKGPSKPLLCRFCFRHWEDIGVPSSADQPFQMM